MLSRIMAVGFPSINVSTLAFEGKQMTTIADCMLAIIDIVWPTFLGGCSITRDTEKWLREAGKWREVDLTQPPTEPYYQVVPHAMGVLKK